MPETIKEIYDNVTILFNNIANNFIGSSLNNYTLKNIEYNVNGALIAKYPYYKFDIKIHFNQLTHTLSIDLNPDFSTFPKISYKNYHTHNFIEIKKDEHYFISPILKCSDCQLQISETGALLDGDFSCDEFKIKKLLE